MANTGKLITLTLKEVVAPGYPGAGNPTGGTKSNTPEDAHYIAPSTDLDRCSVSSGTTCPVAFAQGITDKIYYEFNLPTAAASNTAIKKVVVQLKQGSSLFDSVTYPLPHVTYFNGNFSLVANGTYDLHILYLGTDDAVVNTCAAVVSAILINNQ